MHFQNKRSKLHAQLLKSDLTWKKIIKFVDDNLDKKEYQTVNGDLKTILQAAKQIGMSSFSSHLIIHYFIWGWELVQVAFCLHTCTLLVKFWFYLDADFVLKYLWNSISSDIYMCNLVFCFILRFHCYMDVLTFLIVLFCRV